MAMNRRTVLITGASAVIIGGASWAMTREPKTARAPWRQASDGFGDPRLDILSYAILAPSPHNMQPWRIRLDGDDAFTVFCDLTRTLPETDPPNRQLTIGFGCFLELARQAALEKGYHAQISTFPEGEPFPLLDERPIAQMRLIKDDSAAHDPLFSEALTRRTNRAAFDVSVAPSNDALAAIESAAPQSVSAQTSTDEQLIGKLRALTVAAWETELANAPTRQESVDVTRIGKKEVNANPNGISLAGAPIEALSAFGVITREEMNAPGSVAYEQTREFYNKACESATAYAWIITETNTRADQLEAGRAWVRMQLAANANDVAFHPLSQALQEFPAMAAHYKDVHELLNAEGQTIQMLSRLGIAKAPAPAPREPLMSKLVEI